MVNNDRHGTKMSQNRITGVCEEEDPTNGTSFQKSDTAKLQNEKLISLKIDKIHEY